MPGPYDPTIMNWLFRGGAPPDVSPHFSMGAPPPAPGPAGYVGDQGPAGGPVGQALDSVGLSGLNPWHWGDPPATMPSGPQPHFGPVPGIDISPESFGLTGGPTTTPIPDALTIPPPPDRTIDPALAEREQFMEKRGGRIHDIYQQYLAGLESEDPSKMPWWRRLGGAFSAMGAGGDLAHAGQAVGQYLEGERAQRQAIRDAVMRMGLSEEDVGMDTENAHLGRISGEHSVGEENTQNRYTTDVTNLDRQDTRHVAQIQENNANSRVSWQAQREVALQRYAQALQELHAAQQVAASLGGEAGLASTESMLGRLPENLQVQATEQLARRGLIAAITQAGQPDRIHRQMETFAGHRLPRMPDMNQHSPDQIAEWYIQHGVNLASPAVIHAFPGFGAPSQ